MSMSKIRPADLDDIPALIRAGEAHHKELGMPWPYDEISTAKTLGTLISADTLLVADDGDIVGYIGFEIGGIYFNHDATLAVEHFWYVRPDQRANGIGMELLQAAERHAQQKGATWFSVQLPPNSEKARTLAEQRGYKEMHLIYGTGLWPDQS
jgi:GNAT superfamily N-acetyltransferase